MMLCSIADQLGRRPVYLLLFFVYVLANVGLALQTSYPVLLVLRMLQSAGGSATVGLIHGVLGDITKSSDRGAYMRILCAGPNAAPSLGPVLGGLLVHEAGWRWTFGFLAISAALSLLLLAVILPEIAQQTGASRNIPAWAQAAICGISLPYQTNAYLLVKTQAISKTHLSFVGERIEMSQSPLRAVKKRSEKH